MNAEQLQDRIREIHVENHALALHYAGLQNIFNAAAVQAHGGEMDAVREKLHALLDEQLDNNASVFMLTRQLIALGGQT